jgi:hypothetical protein
MAVLTWDGTGEKFFESGVDRGVLYLPDVAGVYDTGVPWNGLISVTEAPSGAEPNPQYADNIKYLNLISAEDFSGTIEAYTFPDEFLVCDGSIEPVAGLQVTGQDRKTFGLSYRTKLGNDVAGQDLAYKIHLVYGALAAPSEKSFQTINESPEALTFSWEFSTTPAPMTGYKPTALLVVNSLTVGTAELAALEDVLYGTAGTDAALPTPDEVLALLTP